MDDTPNTTVEAAARALIQREMAAKLDIVERLARSQKEEDDAVAKLAEIQRARQLDWQEAQNLGWDPQVLRKKLGLRQPGESNARTPRRGKSGTSRSGRRAPTKQSTDAPAGAPEPPRAPAVETSARVPPGHEEAPPTLSAH